MAARNVAGLGDFVEVEALGCKEGCGRLFQSQNASNFGS